MTTDWSIRHATNIDCPAIFQLIDMILGEWNDRACIDDAEKDLLDVESNYFDLGGVFIVLEAEGKILGTHAALPVDQSTCTFKRLYLHKTLRGGAAGTELMQWTIDWAIEKKFQKIEFWSDTRFDRAHRFFSKFGFKKSGEKRQMFDSFDPYHEFYFSKTLDQNQTDVPCGS